MRAGPVAGGVALLLVSLFMLSGFLRSDLALGSPATMAALLVSVVLPAIGGSALLAWQLRGRGRLEARREELRLRTVHAEVLRLAEQLGGRITVVEVMRDLALPADAAQAALNALHAQELAEIEITDAGVLVYVMRDLQRLDEKHTARGLLDA